MPTYQYACTNAECGHRFEQVQSFTDAAITDCPQCAERVRKVYGSVGVVFKGSGFYRTDSRDTKTASSEPKGEAKATESKGTESKGTESKAAASQSSDSGSSSSSSSSSTPSTSSTSSTPRTKTKASATT